VWCLRTRCPRGSGVSRTAQPVRWSVCLWCFGAADTPSPGLGCSCLRSAPTDLARRQPAPLLHGRNCSKFRLVIQWAVRCDAPLVLKPLCMPRKGAVHFVRCSCVGMLTCASNYRPSRGCAAEACVRCGCRGRVAANLLRRLMRSGIVSSGVGRNLVAFWSHPS